MGLYFQNGMPLLRDGMLAFGVDCCCPTAPPALCLVADSWRIVSGGYVYAQGVINPYGGVGDPSLSHLLEDFPVPFFPLFYWGAGPQTFRLEIQGCDDTDPAAWQVLEEWSGEIILCGTTADRYPSHYTIGPWAPPPDTPCECINIANVRLGLELCDACPPYVAGTPGTGQGFRSPPHEVGKTFTNEVDGEWTNLMNWADENGRRPASELPGVANDVIISGDVTSSAETISVDSLTIEAGAAFSVAATAADLHVYGTVARESDCDGVFGDITVTDDAIVYSGGVNGGRIATLTRVEFRGTGSNGATGEVAGDARFKDTSRNDGTVEGDGEFFDTAANCGTVDGDAVFNNNAYNATTDALVKGNAEFNDASWNYEGTVEGNSVFRGTSKNDGNIDGDAEFNGDSWNGYEFGGGVGGTATFRDSSNNSSILATGVFYDTSKNTLSPAGISAPPGQVTAATFHESSVNLQFVANATFNGYSANEGTVDADATFNGDSINRGAVAGTATFTDSACNDGGTAGTFVPDPPPSC